MSKQNEFEGMENEVEVVDQGDIEVIDNNSGDVVMFGKDKLILAGLIGAGIAIGGGLLINRVLKPFCQGAIEGVKKANKKHENKDELDE